MSKDSKVVLFNGPRNSGKTLATKFILHNFPGTEKITCKDKLHELTMTLFGVSPTRYWEIYNDQDMKEIPLPEFRVSLVGKDKQLIKSLLPDLDFWDDEIRSWTCDISNTKHTLNLSCREAMIYVSEVIVKSRFGSSFFGQARAQAILQSDNSLFIDDSAAFLEECPPLIEAVGQDNILLVRTCRDGSTFEGDSRDYLPDGIFKNTITLFNDGTEKEWLDKIDLTIGAWLCGEEI